MRVKFLIPLILLAVLAKGQNSCFDDCSKIMRSDLPFTEKLTILNGCSIPIVAFKDIDDQVLDISLLKGKTLVINFWYIGCAPCRAEIPGLNELASKYRDENIAFLAFALDKPDPLRNFLKKHSFEYRIIPNSQAIADKFCIVTGYPTNIIVGPEGKVRHMFSGGRVDDMASADAIAKIDPIIQKILKEGK
jgi:peroxiredoxin